jgi:hypothetical protein
MYIISIVKQLTIIMHVNRPLRLFALLTVLSTTTFLLFRRINTNKAKNLNQEVPKPIHHVRP